MDLDDFLEEVPWRYELATPMAFVPMDLELDGAELRAAAARLVDERAAVEPLVAQRRRRWVRYLVRTWEDARDHHVLDAWTMVHDADGLPVRAVLWVLTGEREHPDDNEAEIRSLESALAVAREGDVGERQVGVIELPAGPAVRVRALLEADPGEHRSLVMDVVDYWVPVPGQPETLVLTLASPDLVVADILAEIADDIAQTLRFTP